MQECKEKVSVLRSIAGWAFDPFSRLDKRVLLVSGVFIIILSGFIGSLSRTHFDGVLDLHTGLATQIWVYPAEGIINWVILSASLMVAAVIAGERKMKGFVLYANQAFARYPMLGAGLVSLVYNYETLSEKLASNPEIASKPAELMEIIMQHPMDLVLIIFAALFGLLMIIWMVALMYKGYVRSCGLSTARRIVSFIIALIVAEIISNLVILPMLMYFRTVK